MEYLVTEWLKFKTLLTVIHRPKGEPEDSIILVVSEEGGVDIRSSFNRLVRRGDISHRDTILIHVTGDSASILTAVTELDFESLVPFLSAAGVVWCVITNLIVGEVS